MKNFSIILLLVWCGTAYAETAYVIDNVNAKLRSGKGENYRTLRILPAKTEVEVVESDEEFTKVKTAEGQFGWIKSSLLKSQRSEGKEGVENLVAPLPQLDGSKDTSPQNEAIGAKPQGDLVPVPHRQETGDTPLVTLLIVGLVAFLAGVAVGVAALRAYYLRRLHGLRI